MSKGSSKKTATVVIKSGVSRQERQQCWQENIRGQKVVKDVIRTEKEIRSEIKGQIQEREALRDYIAAAEASLPNGIWVTVTYMYGNLLMAIMGLRELLAGSKETFDFCHKGREYKGINREQLVSLLYLMEAKLSNQALTKGHEFMALCNAYNESVNRISTLKDAKRSSASMVYNDECADRGVIVSAKDILEQASRWLERRQEREAQRAKWLGKEVKKFR